MTSMSNNDVTEESLVPSPPISCQLLQWVEASSAMLNKCNEICAINSTHNLSGEVIAVDSNNRDAVLGRIVGDTVSEMRTSDRLVSEFLQKDASDVSDGYMQLPSITHNLFDDKAIIQPGIVDTILKNTDDDAKNTDDIHDNDVVIININVIKAEILWALKIISSNQTFHSFYGTNEFFKLMFPDSLIARQLMFSRDWFSHMLCSAIAPYMQSLLRNELARSDYYVIRLDETRGNHFEIDFSVTYWDCARERNITRYLNTSYLERTQVDDMVWAFQEVTGFLDEKKILQVTTTGARSNWSYLKVLNERRRENNYPKLINIGNCDVQTIDEAFRCGAEKTGWKYKRIFKSLFESFHGKYFNRSNYVTLTGSSMLPLPFCGSIWIENGAVARRAIDIWDNVTKFMRFWSSLPTSRRPTSKSLWRMAELVNDKMILAKLHFFSYLARTIKPFYTTYQTSKPMVPFLHDDLHNLVRKLLAWFIKSSVLCDALTAIDLCAIDIDNNANHVAMDSLNIGFGAENVIRLGLRNRSITENDVLSFKRGCFNFLIELIGKTVKQSFLFSSIAKNSSSLNPNHMITDSDACKIMFKSLTEKLTELKRLTRAEASISVEEYNEFIYRVVNVNKRKFQSFSKTDDRLDSFFFSEVTMDGYPSIANVFRLILCLHHGQKIQTRHSNEADMSLTSNITEACRVSERVVQDHMTAKNLSPESFVITREFVDVVGVTRSKYRTFVDELRKRKNEEMLNLGGMMETHL